DVDATIVVIVGKGSTAARAHHLNAWTRDSGDVEELTISAGRGRVVVQKLALRIGRVDTVRVDLRRKVTIRHQQVRPAIIVVIEESQSPAEIVRMLAEP